MNKKIYTQGFHIKLIFVLSILILTSFTGCSNFVNEPKLERYPESKAITMANDYIKNKYAETLDISNIETKYNSTPLGNVFDGYIIKSKAGYYIQIYIPDDVKSDKANDKIILSDTKQFTEVEESINEYLKHNSISDEFYVTIFSAPQNIRFNYVSTDSICSNGFTEKYSNDIKLFLNNNPNHKFNFYFKDNGKIEFKQFLSEFQKIKDDLNIDGSAVLLNAEVYDRFMEKLKSGDENVNIALHQSGVIHNYFDNYYFTKYTTAYCNNLVNYSDSIKIGLLKENISSINLDDIMLNMAKLSEKTYFIKNSENYEILSDIYQFRYAKDEHTLLNLVIDTKKSFPNISSNEKIVLGDVKVEKIGRAHV